MIRQKRCAPRSHTRFLSMLMLAVFVCMMAGVVSVAQKNKESRAKLETRKKKLEDEIAYNRQLLEETRKNKNVSVNQLNLLSSQIRKREALLNEINDGIDSLTHEIRTNDEMLLTQQTNLRVLKTEYARIIYHEWKMRNAYDRLLFVFSAEDFNQAFHRIQYFKQYSDYRKKQAGLIVSVTDDIQRRVTNLKTQKIEKVGLQNDNEAAKAKLDREKQEKDAMLKKLKNQEARIKKTLDAKQAEARKLKSKIEAIIAEEIKKSSTKTNTTVTGTNVKNVLTPEEKLISDNFTSNRGKLPWPVAAGVISSYFGEHDHPVLAGIKVKNNGIDLSTSHGSTARSVFGGTVVNVVSVSETNKVVIIRHGDFFTVYSNLISVSVSKGSKVSTKQSVGTIATDPEDGKTELHFEVWEGKLVQNPTSWLTPR